MRLHHSNIYATAESPHGFSRHFFVVDLNSVNGRFAQWITNNFCLTIKTRLHCLAIKILISRILLQMFKLFDTNSFVLFALLANLPQRLPLILLKIVKLLQLVIHWPRPALRWITVAGTRFLKSRLKTYLRIVGFQTQSLLFYNCFALILFYFELYWGFFQFLTV